MVVETSGTRQDIGLLEKAFLMGVGAAAYAKDKAQELADDLVTRGALSREESDTFVSRVVAQAGDVGRSFQETVARETERVVQGMGVASAQDVQDIRLELLEIKALIASMRPVSESDTDTA